MTCLLLISLLFANTSNVKKEQSGYFMGPDKFTLFAEWKVLNEEKSSLREVAFYPNKSVIFRAKGKSTTLGYRIVKENPEMILGEILVDHPYYRSKNRTHFKIQIQSSDSVSLMIFDSLDMPVKSLNLKKIRDIEYGIILTR